MKYWIILLAVAVLILVTMIVTIVNIVKESRQFKNQQKNNDYDDEDDYERRPVRKAASSGNQGGRNPEAAPERRAPRQEARQEPRQEPPVRREQARQAASEGQRRRWKVILDDVDTRDRFSFIFYDTLGIGRSEGTDDYEEFLSLPDDHKISKIHCAIVRNRDKLYLQDEGSKNHTYLNGERIEKPILIQKEDMIGIGETKLEIVKILRET